MRLGLDFYGTIDTAPKAFKQLAALVISSGGAVYIVSQIESDSHRKRLLLDIRRSHVPYTDVVVVVCPWGSAPKEKFRVIRSLHLDFYIDDRADTIRALASLPTIGLCLGASAP